MNPKSLFDELDDAYKAGYKAKKNGKPFASNPYPLPDKHKSASRGQTPFGHWGRGWLAGPEKKGRKP